jgi:nucleoside-diphosphate-sugar epimerase
MVQIWLSGSNGFVGKHIVTYLDNNMTYDYLFFSLHKTGFRLLDPNTNKSDFFLWSDPLSFNRPFPNFILHFGASGVGDPLKYSIHASNYQLTKYFCNFLSDCKYEGKFIFAGTIDEYESCVHKREDEIVHLHKLDPYAHFKLKTFQSFKRIFQPTDIQYSHLRIANLYGLGQRSGTLFPLLISKDIHVLNVNNLDYYRDLLFVGDFVSNLFSFLQLESIPELVNVGSGRSALMSDFARLAWTSAGKDLGLLTFGDPMFTNSRKRAVVHMNISLARKLLKDGYACNEYENVLPYILKGVF